MRSWSVLSLFLFPLLCSSTSFAQAAELGYRGTHTLTYGALEDLAAAFRAKYGIPVFVKGGSCADGIAAVVQEKHQMGGICCPLDPQLAKKHDLVAHRIAVDAKAVIVNPRNPVQTLSLKQVAGIYKGTIVNWEQTGVRIDGKDGPVAVIYREHCKDMDEPVRKVLGIKGPVSEKTIFVRTDREVVEYVERFPSAIAVVSRIFAENAKVKMIEVDGVAPEPENVKQGRYPLKGDLFILTKARPSRETRRFLDFVMSDEGQSIVRKRFAGVK